MTKLLLDELILSAIKDTFNTFLKSKQEKLQKEIETTIFRNSKQRKKKENIYERLTKEEAKLESLNCQLIEFKKKDYSKLLKDFISYIFDC